MKKYTIIAITQIHNELRKGHLERFFRYIPKAVDAVVVYDDASTDGSWEYANKHTPHVIRGEKNDFSGERDHKKAMLEKALELKADFILSIDADEVVTDFDGSKLQQLAAWVAEKDLDGAKLHDINLWRSSAWARTDNDFDAAHFLRFWRVRPGIGYSGEKRGLHQSPAPDTIKNVADTDIVSLLHFGFAEDRGIISKYLTYGKLGQQGENLARLIDESQLQLRPVDSSLFPECLYAESPKPQAKPLTEWISLAHEMEEDLSRPSISIVALIYKSTDWLAFCYDQVQRYTDLTDKEFFFVANDATEDVKQYLHNHYIPHYLFENSEAQRQEWYINNVYRAWNYGAQKAKGDYVLFINSDMAFSPGWVEKLFAGLDSNNCVCSHLVESGKLETGGLNIEKDFGKFIEEYREQGFQGYAKTISEKKILDGGAVMPLLIKREDFLKSGGYPEGNTVPGSDIWKPEIAKKGDPATSGDVVLMAKLKTLGIRQQTVYDSVVYHFQEGEMTSIAEDLVSEKSTEVVIANNSLRGLMNEKVMWNFLLEQLPNTQGVDYESMGTDREFEQRAREYIAQHYPNAGIVLQNASFIDFLQPALITVSYLQDNLRRMGKVSYQQERNLEQSQVRVTNSFDTAASYPEYFFRVIPIGVDALLFQPGDKQQRRSEFGIGPGRVGIFVGDLTPVKGWEQVKSLIVNHPEITWIVVSKSPERYERANVKMFNKIDQVTLSKLLQCADFFVVGSPVETQCLAAMEACFCDVPVIMRQIGIFANVKSELLSQCGIFGEDFEAALAQLPGKEFHPRNVMLSQQYDTQGMVNKWWHLIAEIKLQIKMLHAKSAVSPSSVSLTRRRLLMMLRNKNYMQVVLKKKLPPIVYRLVLWVWRTSKSIKQVVKKK